MLSYSVGDRVRFHAPRYAPKTGVIAKYNRKTVTVVTEDQRHCNVARVSPGRLLDVDADEVAAKHAIVVTLLTKL